MCDLVITPEGDVQAFWDDALVEMFTALGAVTVTRASLVEYDHALGGWTVCSADGQPLLPGAFRRRQDALTAEVAALTPQLGTL